MADNDKAQSDFFNPDKPSVLKQAFQWAGAFVSMIEGDAPQNGFVATGNAYDWAKAKLYTATHKPKPAQ